MSIPRISLTLSYSSSPCPSNSRISASAMPSSSNLDGYYVAVLHNVIATLYPQQPLLAPCGSAAALDKRLPADHLGFDERFHDLGVDRAGGLQGGGAAGDRPRHRLLALAGGEEGDQLEQVVGGADQARQARALDAVALAHFRRFGRVELGQLGLDPGADRDHAGVDRVGVGGDRF